VAYKEVGDKMKIQYLIDKFEVEFDRKTIGDIVSFRGRFMHTGMDRKMEARNHYQNVLGILERTLLAMLGWKGNQYIDRLSDYGLKTLKLCTLSEMTGIGLTVFFPSSSWRRFNFFLVGALVS
jgi:hypothetical protein